MLERAGACWRRPISAQGGHGWPDRCAALDDGIDTFVHSPKPPRYVSHMYPTYVSRMYSTSDEEESKVRFARFSALWTSTWT